MASVISGLANVSNSWIKDGAVRRGLLVAQVACAAISLIPPFRFVGAILLRSTAALSAGVISSESWQKDDALQRASKCAKIGICALGLAGVVVASPLLLTASLVADMALQAFDAGSAFYNRDFEKVGFHAGVFMIDSFALAAIATGAWPFMVTAAVVSMFVMGAAAIKGIVNAKSGNEAIEAGCYAALALCSGVAAFKACEISYTYAKTAHFRVSNQYKTDLKVLDRYGDVVQVVKPGQTVDIALAHSRSSPIYKTVFIYDSRLKMIMPHAVEVGRQIQGVVDNQSIKFHPYQTEYATNMLHEAIDAKDFPTLPIGGPSVVKK